MKNPKIKAWIAAAAFFAGSAIVGSPAMAVPLMLDFTDGAWLGAQGQSTYTRNYGSVDVTLSTSGPLTFNAWDTPDWTSPDLTLAGDGIGVGDDEISWGERIDVYFSTPVTVLGYYFLDFFLGEGPNGSGELATVVFDAVSFVDEALAADAVGYYGRDVSIVTTSISFFAGLMQSAGDFGFSDFALAGILIDDGAPLLDAGVPPLAGTGPVTVPEPPPLALLTLGLLGLVLCPLGRTRA